MLWNLDASWLMMAVAVVAVLSFMLGSVLNGVMGDDGFGPTGNMLVITAGFFLSIFTANSWGVSLRDLVMAVGVGLGGAFLCLFGLALLKAGLSRI
jgi:hypothetical protein